MRCECLGEIVEYRMAQSDGELCCCNASRCRYRAGDYILTLDNPLAPGEKCETAMNSATFAMACKVIS
jgi:hypothetical protein